MADINNNDIWIDVETLAKLKNDGRYKRKRYYKVGDGNS